MSANSGLLIKNGRIIDPASNRDEEADLLIEAGRIVGFERNISADGAEVVDAAGKVIVPGLIDLHVHLREPGLEYKEDVRTGSLAAARGGFTTVACMPNTKPVLDTPELIRYIYERSREVGLARVLPIGAVTKGQEGKELAEIGLMAEAGVVGISDDGYPVRTSRLMRLALEYAKMFDLPVIDHCEDPELAAGGVMNEGLVSTTLGLRGQPAEAEEVLIARDILLARMTGGHFHAAHVSTRGSVDLIRRAKADGIRVTAEVTPHHLVLTDEEVRRSAYSGHTKMNPPLRTQDDVEALIEGLQDGTVDFIATDHAPHHADEKEVEFDRAAFGIVGLETAFPILYTELVLKGRLTLTQLIHRFTAAPAAAFGLPYGKLERGAVADVTVLDLNESYELDPNEFVSRGKNTPFAGRRVQGLVTATILEGRFTWQSAATVRA